MKANKKTLAAVKRYILEPEGYDMDELIGGIISETGCLKVDDLLVDHDECEIKWDGEPVCNLDDFVVVFTDKFIEHICNVLDSFVDEDIDCYLED